MKHVFLYCDETATRDVTNRFTLKDYHLMPLTSSPVAFWKGVEVVGNDGVLVVYSHGNICGPLLVRGQTGDDITLEEAGRLGTALLVKNVKLYLLSCEAGKEVGDADDKDIGFEGKPNAFLRKLFETQVEFIAPKSKVVCGSSPAAVTFQSAKGWSGSATLLPRRSTSPLQIPSPPLKKKRSASSSVGAEDPGSSASKRAKPDAES